MSKTFVRQFVGACVALAASVSTQANAATLYNVTDLSQFNGASTVLGLNDLGDLTGGAGGSYYAKQTAFVQSAAGFQSLGTLPLSSWPFGTSSSSGTSINDNGQVVGNSTYALTSNPNTATTHAFLYDGTSMQDLGTLGGKNSTGKAINDSGTVVGWSETAEVVPPGGPFSGTPIKHAFIYRNGVMTDIGAAFPSLDSYAYAINENGWVTGSVSTNSYSSTAFIYDGTQMTLLSSIPGNYSTGVSINAQGWVAGSTGRDAFLYKGPDEVINLGAGLWSSSAQGINDQGYVVGEASSDDLRAYAFVYDGSSVLNLNQLLAPGNSYWYIRQAFAINNAGQILAEASDGRTVLLTPVPEPATCILTGTGMLLLSFLARRKLGKAAQNQA